MNGGSPKVQGCPGADFPSTESSRPLLYLDFDQVQLCSESLTAYPGWPPSAQGGRLLGRRLKGTLSESLFCLTSPSPSAKYTHWNLVDWWTEYSIWKMAEHQKKQAMFTSHWVYEGASPNLGSVKYSGPKKRYYVSFYSKRFLSHLGNCSVAFFHQCCFLKQAISLVGKETLETLDFFSFYTRHFYIYSELK